MMASYYYSFSIHHASLLLKISTAFQQKIKRKIYESKCYLWQIIANAFFIYLIKNGVTLLIRNTTWRRQLSSWCCNKHRLSLTAITLWHYSTNNAGNKNKLCSNSKTNFCSATQYNSSKTVLTYPKLDLFCRPLGYMRDETGVVMIDKRCRQVNTLI